MNKKKIALIIDTEGWAFDNIAKQIKDHLVEYEIDIIPGRIFQGNMIKLFLMLHAAVLLCLEKMNYLN